MLLVFMGLLNMTGGNIPPIPTPTSTAGGVSKKDFSSLEERALRERFKKSVQDDEDILLIVAQFAVQKNSN